MIVNSNTYFSTTNIDEKYFDNYKFEISNVISKLDKNKNNFHNLIPLKKRTYQIKNNELTKDNINLEMAEILKKLNIDEYIFFNILSNNKKFYEIKKITKKSGKLRILHVPCNILKLLQRYILENILYPKIDIINFNSCVTGFIKDKSTKDNAFEHLNKKYLIKIDIKDFFPSISRYMIFKILERQLKISYKEAYLYSKIVTYDGILPQGGITSPFISNMCLYKFDCRITSLIKSINKYEKIDGSYTRFADDLTFSFNSRIDFNRFIDQIYEIIYNEGYIPNYTKTKLLHNTVRQEVTGIIVNGKELSISKKTRDDIRFILNIWKKFGKEEASNKYNIIFGKSNKSFLLRIESFISYIKDINNKQGEKLKKLLIKIK